MPALTNKDLQTTDVDQNNCQFCGTTMSEWVPRRKSLHIRACTEEAISKCRSCPGCTKQFNKKASRAHLKKCAAELSMSLSQLMTLNHHPPDQRQSSGIPQSLSSIEASRYLLPNSSTTNSKQPASSNQSESSNINRCHPEVDDELSTAVALSLSMREEVKRRDKEAVQAAKLHPIDLGPPNHLLITADQRRTILCDRLASTLLQVKKPCQQTPPRQQSHLWQLAQLENVATSDLSQLPDQDETTNFYVNRLVPPLSPARKAWGRNLSIFSLSQIPGRASVKRRCSSPPPPHLLAIDRSSEDRVLHDQDDEYVENVNDMNTVPDTELDRCAGVNCPDEINGSSPFKCNDSNNNCSDSNNLRVHQLTSSEFLYLLGLMYQGDRVKLIDELSRCCQNNRLQELAVGWNLIPPSCRSSFNSSSISPSTIPIALETSRTYSLYTTPPRDSINLPDSFATNPTSSCTTNRSRSRQSTAYSPTRFPTSPPCTVKAMSRSQSISSPAPVIDLTASLPSTHEHDEPSTNHSLPFSMSPHMVGPLSSPPLATSHSPTNHPSDQSINGSPPLIQTILIFNQPVGVDPSPTSINDLASSSCSKRQRLSKDLFASPELSSPVLVQDDNRIDANDLQSRNFFDSGEGGEIKLSSSVKPSMLLSMQQLQSDNPSSNSILFANSPSPVSLLDRIVSVANHNDLDCCQAPDIHQSPSRQSNCPALIVNNSLWSNVAPSTPLPNGDPLLPSSASIKRLFASPMQFNPSSSPFLADLDQLVTPLPNYPSMLTPELRKALSAYGVKPLPRRKAVTLLNAIFHELHPDQQPPSTPTIQHRPQPKDTRDGGGGNKRQRKQGPQSPLRDDQKRRRDAALEPPRPQSDAVLIGPPSLTTNTIVGQVDFTTAPPQVIAEHRQQELATAQSTNTNGLVDLVDNNNKHVVNDLESAAEADDDNRGRLFELSPTMDADSNTQDDGNDQNQHNGGDLTKLDSRSAVLAYLKSNNDLFGNIVTYVPLEFDALRAELKAADIVIGAQKLMDLLDEQCITFTLRNRSRGGQHKARRKPLAGGAKRGRSTTTTGRR